MCPGRLRSEQRKDAGRANIGNIGPTEDAAMRRFAAVCARHPRLAEVDVRWFGHRLQGDNRGRYHALGYVADPDAGLEEGRGFVVDVVAGHVMRELPLERRRDLPTDISALA